MNLTQNIYRIISYALDTNLIEKEDVIYCQNQLLELFKMDNPEEGFETFVKTDESYETLEEIMNALCDAAFEKGLIQENTVTFRDLFDGKIMNIFMPRPSEVQRKFWEEYKKSPKAATSWYYALSRSSNYIKTYRIKKDLKWETETDFGKLDITINLSKPEKDPKAIALAKTQKQSGYPKCLLCPENEGYAGRVNHPARNNHRIIPITLNNEDWFVQYSPYVYYNEHCIVFNKKHTPMIINSDTFKKLFDFESLFPHYTIGSNADLPIVGGSILTHEHFQGGAYTFPLNRAPVLKKFSVKGYNDVECGIVKWPMSVIRLTSKNTESLVKLAGHILDSWKNYTDKDAFIFAETEGTPHNTITPIASRNGENYVLDLVLRNNITTEEHPLGVYHPHAELHHIKKENIGLIEVMGLAVLPSRLKGEIEILKNCILEGKDVASVPEVASHAEWIKTLLEKHNFTAENAQAILQDEIGKVFAQVLRDAGVYKQTEEGIKAFERFTSSL